MQSIFNEKAYKEINERINLISKNSEAQWGKMNVAQMVWHCQGPFNIMLQKEDYGMKPNWLAKMFFKKSLYNNKSWRKNLPTAKFLKTKESKDFEAEKSKLITLINETYEQKNKPEWQPHPAFGFFTAAQWGQMQYKHLDHHLKQFGV